jgi:hypothetical protein
MRLDRCKDMSMHVSTCISYDFNALTPVVWKLPANFSLRHHVQTASGAHPASYPVGTGDSLLGAKAARA